MDMKEMTKDEFDSILEAVRELITESLNGKYQTKDEDNTVTQKDYLNNLINKTKILQLEDIEEGVIEVRSNVDLSLINVNPSASEIINKIKAIKKKPLNKQPKVITCLFYGAPGTGKTTMATEIVKSLGKKALIRSYADIQSKYVGEGEKRLQALFAEARENDKVLILDECDALMASREASTKEWQQSMTNQFLTELDKHHGIFIATTNFVERLDAACLRRLFLKLEFKWMTNEQKNKAFKIFFNRKINNIPVDFLTAGDFKAVKERSLYEPTIKITNNNYIKLLKEEVEYKKKTIKEVNEAAKRKIGF